MVDLVFQKLLKQFIFDGLISSKFDETWSEIVIAGLETCQLNAIFSFDEIEKLRGIVSWLPNNICKIRLIKIILFADRDEKPDLTLLEEFCISIKDVSDPPIYYYRPTPTFHRRYKHNFT